jgi:hypothetical protein
MKGGSLKTNELKHFLDKSNSIISFTDVLPYNVIAFNEGGSYNTINYEYTIPVRGII